MVRRFLTALVGLFIAFTLGAQNYKVTLKLADSATNEPVGFATVSLIPEKGSTKYSLSDNAGNATLEKVRAGKYTLKAELLGYVPYTHELTVKDRDLNLGTIKMEADTQVLDAASVSATGNPIIIKKDTVEYNASSFKISDDNMLVDLLKKLPGIEVADDGSITSNGETISKITIDGKTFFLDDPQLASNNIPAKLIEKVKVVKNKVAPPFRTAEFDIIFGKGICKIGNILDVAVDLDIVKKAGSWFSFNDEKLGQGRDKAKEFLAANPDVLDTVEKLVREKLAENS